MEADLRQLVISATGLTAFRVNWGQNPGAGLGPYVVLHLISWTSGHTMAGPDGLNTTRVQMDCYGSDWATARGLAGQVKGALDGYRGGAFSAIFADGMRLTREGGAGALDGGANGGEAMYRASLDFITHWRASDAG